MARYDHRKYRSELRLLLATADKHDPFLFARVCSHVDNWDSCEECCNEAVERVFPIEEDRLMASKPAAEHPFAVLVSHIEEKHLFSEYCASQEDGSDPFALN